MKKTVLVFVIDRPKNLLLMIFKKRGQGEGKWNMPGGKIQAEESAEAAAIRETKEETGLTVKEVNKMGELEFVFAKGTSWDNQCTVFLTEEFSGTLRLETQECFAEWRSLAEIPYDQMWDDDKLWIPHVFSGRPFHLRYTFDESNKMLKEESLLKH